MSFLPNNPRLIASLKKTFADLATALDVSIRNVWRGADRPPDGKMVLANQLLSVARQFVDVRNCSIEEKQSYFETVCGWFDLECEENAFPLPAPLSFNPNISQRFDRTPVVISYLEEYDRRCGFNYADRTRHALFQFANLVIKSDGTVTSSEAAALLQFKTTLYPHGGDPSVEDNTPKSGEIIATPTETSPVEDDASRPLEELLKELDGLVGLHRVKTDVRQLINFLKVQKMREEKGMLAAPISRHLVFYGNPGTGKTTMARLLAQVYRSLQILSRGHLIESDRGDLVAGYVGQTALKVKEVVRQALGGVLFIDEAYALNGEGRGNDFGQEAVETLLKLMEDHRHDFVVIVAGYTEKMEEFISSNPGLRSRFTKFLHFEDYTPEQLIEIFKGFCAKASFKLSSEAEQRLLELFKLLSLARDESFGNARTARNLFEMTISKQANRIVTLPNINEEVLATIDEADIPTVEELRSSGVRLPPELDASRP
ncbi:MAG: AAA family ATPase [Acidobacteria bacterium]|nr:MAG: AAA family ATPase [Acidobacteriota bacterium]